MGQAETRVYGKQAALEPCSDSSGPVHSGKPAMPTGGVHSLCADPNPRVSVVPPSAEQSSPRITANSGTQTTACRFPNSRVLGHRWLTRPLSLSRLNRLKSVHQS
jgi:hypothetical protein